MKHEISNDGYAEIMLCLSDNGIEIDAFDLAVTALAELQYNLTLQRTAAMQSQWYEKAMQFDWLLNVHDSAQRWAKECYGNRTRIEALKIAIEKYKQEAV
jgi:hypothetical protein